MSKQVMTAALPSDNICGEAIPFCDPFSEADDDLSEDELEEIMDRVINEYVALGYVYLAEEK